MLYHQGRVSVILWQCRHLVLGFLSFIRKRICSLPSISTERVARKDGTIDDEVDLKLNLRILVLFDDQRVWHLCHLLKVFIQAWLHYDSLHIIQWCKKWKLSAVQALVWKMNETNFLCRYTFLSSLEFSIRIIFRT